MAIDLSRLTVVDSEEASETVAFASKKAAFVPLQHIKLAGVQLNLGYMTLDGQAEAKVLKVNGKVQTKDGKPITVTPIRCKLTMIGKPGGATLMSGKFPLAFRFAQAAILLSAKEFEEKLNKVAEDVKALGLTPHFDGID